MRDILLFPFNGNALEAVSVIRDINRLQNEWNILGFIDDDVNKYGLSADGFDVLGGRDQLRSYPHALVLAVPGRPETYIHRRKIIQSLSLGPERYATIVHPTACIGAACKLGHNVLIQPNVVLSFDVSLGNHVVVLPNTVISHGVEIGDYTLIGSNVSLSGNVSVSQNCYIGTGSKVIHDISIGEQALVGLGAVVVRDVQPRCKVAGNPAKELK